MITLLLLALLAASPESANVLVVVNDATVAEAGTGTVGASQYVADHYVASRGIPLANVVHISSKGCCGFADGTSPQLYNNFHVSFDQYVSDILTPIQTYLEGHNLKQQIKYIVTTYGVPTHIAPDYCLDSFLAQMYSNGGPGGGNLVPLTFNPIYNSTPISKPVKWTNIGRTIPIYMVARLDGTSAILANALVDKALVAEKGIAKDSGKGYFDWQHSDNTYDATMKNAYDLCVLAGMQCAINDQSVTHHMIDSAPNTLWAWGWYGGVNDVYSFAPGAVGAQLTSYTASDIRNTNNVGGLWVPWWITKGITATWGATGEPGTSYYAMGDNLLNHMWNGYSFGESSYIAVPTLGWKMIFVGDPLYTLNFTTGPTFSISPKLASISQGQTAQFTVSGLTSNASVVVTSGTASVQAQINVSASTFIPIRMNAGATQPYTDTLGNLWEPDGGFNPECAGLFNSTQATIQGNSSSPAIYQTNHYGSCTFSRPVPNGQYTVKLHFAEIALNSAGRVFNVDLNGARVLTNFDIWQAAGAMNTPVVKTFQVVVTSGKITVNLDIVNYGPVISGIEITN